MRLRILLVSIVASLVLYTLGSVSSHAANLANSQGGPLSFVETHHGGGNPSLTPAARLIRSVELAKAGKVDQAFVMAKDAMQSESKNPLFSVEYLKTLFVLIEFADEEKRGEIVNEAVATVGLLKSNQMFDGHGNPETAYHFMTSVGQLALITLPLSEPTYVGLRNCQGSIARNLSRHPQFPANGKESLAEPLVGLATSHAIGGDQVAALQAISEACELGFCDFEKLATDPLLGRLNDQPALQAHLESLEQAYLVKVKQWGRQQIEEFDSFRLQFNIDDVAGGSLASQDFTDKILVVDFWATWCPPCRQGIPHFTRLQKEFQGQGVQVLGVSMDSPEDPLSCVEVVKNFWAENQVNYPCGLGTIDLKNRVPGEMKLPATLFVDRTGTVRYVATGYHDYAKLSAIAEILANEEQPVHTSTRN